MAEYDSVIPAGGSGKLIANMRTAPLQNRRITKSISVRTDDADLANLNLRFSVDLRAPIIFKPSNRLVVSTVEGHEGRIRVLLQRADGEALEVLSADTGDPTLVAVTKPVVKKERTNDYDAAPGDVWLELVLPADSPIGSHTGKLRLSTNDPIASSFEVPFAMRVRALIEYRPEGVRLWPTPSRSGEGYSAFVNLNRIETGNFTVTGIDVSHPEIFSAAVVSAEPAQRHSVRVELVEGLAPEAISSTIEGWIEISTDDPVRSKIEVPVVIASNRGGTRRPFQTRRTVVE
ncbi:MAG: hypothetical protein OQK55_06885 [Thermoanaerobaculales bacterium]|nr:hypothetical protein [Thermoanaerobaculales bacterium]